MTAARSKGLSVCCMSSGRSPARLASILSLFEDVADEIVVGVEEPRALATHDVVASVADRVLSFPPCGPADRPIAWLFGACRGSWILNIDDDEIPSPALIALLPDLVAREDITHAWIARRWLFPTTATYLDGPPWSTEFQLRLLVADERFVQFSDVFHRPVVAHGPGVFVEAPLWHLDTAVNSLSRRRAKAEAYELERPGMKVGGRAHNHALYLPELARDVSVATVPEIERAWIEDVIAADFVAASTKRASLDFASAREIDLAWPGAPHLGTLHRGQISAVAVPGVVRGGVQETIDVRVTNLGEQTWRWGKDARPEIRLAYRWSADGQPVPEPMALRTVLPADLAPGATQLIPLHVVPPVGPGRYALQLELVHEDVRSFATTAPIELEVRKRELLALVGKPAQVARLLALLAPPPEMEPVVVLGNDSDSAAYGDYLSVSGLRAPLLAGLETSGRVTRPLTLLWRSSTIIRSARRYRRSGAVADTPLTRLFDLLQQSQAVVVAGTDWRDDAAAGREWWRLVTTLLVCRAIGQTVLVADAAIPTGNSLRDKVFRQIILRYGTALGQPRSDDSPLRLEPRPVQAEATEPPVIDVLV